LKSDAGAASVRHPRSEARAHKPDTKLTFYAMSQQAFGGDTDTDVL